VSPLQSEYGDKTVQEFTLLFTNGHLNLEPGFQRDSVWTPSDRKKLIESVLQGYPIPSVFLYRRSDNGRLKYDVIDGKQRLESVLMFQGLGKFRGKRFSLKTRMELDDFFEDWDWRRMCKRGLEHKVMGYKLQTVEVAGDLSDIVDLFVRINSTGKRLTGAEKRHARFYRSSFLRVAARLAERYRPFFIQERILTRGQVSRMKHVELVAELLASLFVKGLINKKTALDNIIAGEAVDQGSLARIARDFARILNILNRMFPDLRATRFANTADFYSLFMLIWDLDASGSVLSVKRRNAQAQRLLEWLTVGVDQVREQLKRAEGAKPDQRLFANYLLTVQGDTDSLATRKRRQEILRQLLGGIFEKKDKNRSFTLEQRRIIWHSVGAKRCTQCRETLTWANFTIDHIKPHTRGGKTLISNAAIMCRPCNSRKGAKQSRMRSMHSR
jgi:hypothetical protein